MSYASGASPPAKSQYHHFVPRFILRNYGDTSKSATPPSPQGRGGKNTAAQLRNASASDAMINLVNLQTMELEQTPLSRAFGLQDMYRDLDRSNSDQHRIERKLSALEGRVSKIIANARQAFEAGKGETHMLRGERDTLRKFLFVMMYRSKKFYRRFNLSTGEYFANDRDAMMKYMKEKGFKKPIDVWFDNLEAFIDLEMDPEMKWPEKLMQRAYPGDAMWFFKNVQMYFLCFCTPKNPENEFLLTENSYGVFEGPNNDIAWTDFHLFAPISPKLIIVLRSALLPSGYDEAEDERLAQLQGILHMQNPLNPGSAHSILEDLPVKKARNNYSKIVNGKPVALPVRIRPENHKFYFEFFQIGAEHVQVMNTIFLENSFGTNVILFKSKPALRQALEAYLTTNISGFKCVSLPPSGFDGPFLITTLDKFEIVDTWPDAEMVAFMKGLERIAGALGSAAKAKYSVVQAKPGMMGIPLFKDQGFMERYEKLGKGYIPGPTQLTG
jgi:hypothetical protein